MIKIKESAVPGQHKTKRLPYYIGSFPVCIVLCWGAGVFFSVFNMQNGTSAVTVQDVIGNLFSLYAKIGIFAGFIAWLMFCMVLASQVKHLETGKEYGEARFAPPKELLPHIAVDEKSDKIISQNLHMGIDDRKTGLNASCLLIGGSGSGKSFRYVAPNLLQANSSFVITDPKMTVI